MDKSLTPPGRESSLVGVRGNKAGMLARKNAVNLFSHSLVMFLIVGQEFFGSYDRHMLDVMDRAFNGLPFFIERKYRDRFKTGINAKNNYGLLAFNSGGECYNNAVYFEAAGALN
jgi:hypothetical protein